MTFDEKSKKHLQKMNEEFGEMCIRLGNIEGRIDEGFGRSNSLIANVVSRMDRLPCERHAKNMLELERKLSNMEGKNWAWSKIKYMFIATATGAVVTCFLTLFLSV